MLETPFGQAPDENILMALQSRPGSGVGRGRPTHGAIKPDEAASHRALREPRRNNRPAVCRPVELRAALTAASPALFMAALRSSGHYASYFPSRNFQVDVPPTSNTLLRREASEGSGGGLSLPPLLAAVIFKPKRRQGPLLGDKQEEADPAAHGASKRRFTWTQMCMLLCLSKVCGDCGMVRSVEL